MLTVIMVMVSTLAIANDKPTVKVESVEAKTVAVIAYGLGGVATDIQLKTGNGKVLYRESVKSGENFAKKLELAAIPAGEYTLEVENANNFTAIPVVLTSSTAVVKIADKVTIVKPQLSLVGNKMNVVIAEELNQEVWVSIFDNDANRLAFEKVTPDNLKRFDLSRLKAGQYTIQLSTGGKNFVQSVSLDK